MKFSEVDQFRNSMYVAQTATMPELAFILQVVDKLEQQIWTV